MLKRQQRQALVDKLATNTYGAIILNAYLFPVCDIVDGYFMSVRLGFSLGHN